jgi:predicted dinucleotide-binding enzyme
MNIAIIGAGNVGKALAGACVRAGHSVTMSCAHSEKIDEAARAALEGMAMLIISLQIRHQWPWQNGWKLVGPPAD